MKKWLVVATVVALAIGIWILRSGEETTATEKSGANASDLARARIARALLTAPLRPQRGNLTVEGVVLGSDGLPVEGATVLATALDGDDVLSSRTCEDESGNERRLTELACFAARFEVMDLVTSGKGEATLVARTKSGPQGRFTLDGLEAGRFALWAEASGLGIATAASVFAGDTSVHLVLEPGIALQGRVADLDQHPLQGARVTAVLLDSSRFVDALTGPDGCFRIAPLPRGSYEVIATASGRVPANRIISGDDVQDLELHLGRSRTIAGTVTQAGQPVAGATVELSPGSRSPLTVISDGEGRFQSSGLRSDRYEITATWGATTAQESVFLQDDEDKLGVRLELAPGASLSGFVTDIRGAPLVAEIVCKVVTSEKVWKVRSAPTGRFAVAGLPPGKYRVTAHARGFFGEDSDIDLAPAGGELRIKLTPAASLTGVVVGPDGSPVRHAEVIADPSTGDTRTGRQTAESDDQGVFEFNELDPSEYHLSATSPRFVASERVVTAPADGVRLVLGQGSALTVRVVDETGVPQSGVRVRIRGSNKVPLAEKSGPTGVDGSIRLEGLAPDRYQVVAELLRDGDQRSASEELELPGPSKLTLRFTAGPSLSGEVVDTEGKPVSGAQVTATGPEREDHWAHSEPDGSFILRHLAEGRYHLRASAEHYEPDEEVDAVAGSSGARIVLVRDWELSGRVVDPSGAPIAKFTVYRHPFEDDEGRFTLDVPVDRDQQPEAVVVSIGADGYATRVFHLESAVGRKTVLGDVVLTPGKKLRGTVVDSLGAPVIDVAVNVIDPETNDVLATAITSANGIFTLEGLPQTNLVLDVTERSHQDVTAPLPPGQQEITLTLPEGDAISGQLVGAAGPPPEWEAFALGEDNEELEARPDAEGRFRIGPVKPGRYRVFAIPKTGPRTNVAEVEVTSGSNGQVVLSASARGAVEIDVEGSFVALLLEGDFQGFDQLHARLRQEPQAWVAVEEGTGRANFTGVPDGFYTLLIRWPDQKVFRRAQFELSGGGTIRIGDGQLSAPAPTPQE